jgi:hypothetical protein
MSFIALAQMTVQDDASPKMAKINRAASDLNKALKALSQGIDINVKSRGLESFINSVDRANEKLNVLKKSASGIQGPPKSPGGGGGASFGGPTAWEVAKGMIIHSAIVTITHAVIHGMSKGMEDADKSNVNLTLAQVGKDNEKAIEEAAARMSKENPSFTIAQMKSMMTENTLMSGKDPATGQLNAAHGIELSERSMRLADLYMSQGKSAEDAVHLAEQAVKVADSTGRIIDKKTGQIDTAKFDHMIDIMVRLGMRGGKMLDADAIRTMDRNLGASRLTLSDEGFMSSAILAREIGPDRAGAGINQLIKGLSGQASAQAKAALVDLGLGHIERVQTGSDSKGRKMYGQSYVANDAQLITSNPLKYVLDKVIPALEKKGVDVNNAEAVGVWLNKLGFSARKDAIFSELLNKRLELKRETDTGLDPNMRTDSGFIKEAMKNSTNVAIATVESQWENSLGQAATSLKDIFIPALDAVSGSLSSVAQFVTNNGTTGKVAAGGLLGGAGLISVIASLKAAGWAWGGLSSIFGGGGAAAGTAATAAEATGAAAGGAGIVAEGAAATTALSGVSVAGTSAIAPLLALGATAAAANFAMKKATGTSLIDSQTIASARLNAEIADSQNKNKFKDRDRQEGPQQTIGEFFKNASSVISTEAKSAYSSIFGDSKKALDTKSEKEIADQTAFWHKYFEQKPLTEKDQQNRKLSDAATQKELDSHPAIGKTDDIRTPIQTGLTQGAANAQPTLRDGIVSGAQTAAGILSSAISSAVSGLSINLNGRVDPSIPGRAAAAHAPTGSQSFGPR